MTYMNKDKLNEWRVKMNILKYIIKVMPKNKVDWFLLLLCVIGLIGTISMFIMPSLEASMLPSLYR